MHSRSRKLFCGLAAVLFTTAVLTACSGTSSQTSEPIKVGVITSLTGSNTAFGQAHKAGYTIAAADINARGGIHGRKIEIIYYDDQSKPDRAVQGVARLVDEEHVPLLLGAYSSESTLAIVPVVTAKQVPIIIPTAVADNIMKANSPWVFRVCAGSGDYARSTLDFLKNNGNPKTVAIVYENTNFGQASYKSMAEAARAQGLELVAEEAYQAKSPTYQPLLRRVKARNPEVIYFASYLFDANALMRQAAEVQLSPAYYTSAGTGFAAAEFPTDKGAGKYANYTFSVAQWLGTAKWQGSQEFDEKYYRLTGTHPAYHAAEAYAAMVVAADALARSNAASPTAIRDAIRTTYLPETVFGPIKFDEHGQNAHPLLVTQVQDQRYRVVWPPDAAEAKPVVPTPAWSQR
ncbi:MAG: ABC transporter substrate-binding protein [Terriglobales bacterium]